MRLQIVVQASKHVTLRIVTVMIVLLCVGCRILSAGEIDHPVDVYQRGVVDSLQKLGVDTIVVFRCWEGMNGINGYGRIVWKERGETSAGIVDIAGPGSPRYRAVDSSSWRVSETDESVIRFALSIPGDRFRDTLAWGQWHVDHDSHMRVEIICNDHRSIYTMRGQKFGPNRSHPKCRLITMLGVDNRFGPIFDE